MKTDRKIYRTQHQSSRTQTRRGRTASTVIHAVSGFSLLELLITLLIVATLSSLAVPAYHGYAANAQHVQAIEKIHIIAQSMERYYTEQQVMTDSFELLGFGPEISNRFYSFTISTNPEQPTWYQINAVSKPDVAANLDYKLNSLGYLRQRKKGGTNWESVW